MNTLLDSIFLRRPKIDYVSPAICEAIFSASGTVTIFLSEFHRHLAPTGGVLGGTGFIFFRWINYPEEICHNVYRAVTADPNGPYSLVSECIPPGVVAVCTAGDYHVTIVTDDGESAPGPTTTCDGLSYVFIPLPQNPDANCFNLYRNGTKIFDCFQGGAFEICEDGCYRTSAITSDGETSLSDPVCTPDCSQVVCPEGQIPNPSNCECIVCPEETCPTGFEWDPIGCQCVAITPPPEPCGMFVDVMGNGISLADLKFGGVVTGLNGATTEAIIYKSRVITSFADDDGRGGILQPQYVDQDGDTYGDKTYGAAPPYSNWHRAFGGAFETIGNANYNDVFQVSDTGIASVVADDGDVKIWKKGSGIVDSFTGGLDGTGAGSAAGPNHVSYFIGSGGGVFFNAHSWDSVHGGIDMGVTSRGFGDIIFNAAGHAFFLVRRGSFQQRDFYYWNGTVSTLILTTTNGGRFSSQLGAQACLTADDVAVGIHTLSGSANGVGIPFMWDSTNGVVSLGLPPGASSAYAVRITDDHIVICGTDIGLFYNYLGTWFDALSVAPFYGTLWTNAGGFKTASRDGYLIGNGTVDGNFSYYVARICPSAFL